MKFIIFKEDNKKEHETFIFFLQYDGNEHMINTLKDIILKMQLIKLLKLS